MEARRIDIRFDRIPDIDAGQCLKYEKLMEINPKYHGPPQLSGVSIPGKAAEKPEGKWNRFDKK